MGYTIKIGEASIHWEDYDVWIDCNTVSRPDAPAFGEPTDFQNVRYPSYGSWNESMTTLGLYDLMKKGVEIEGYGFLPKFMNDSPPSAYPITQKHSDYIQEQLQKYKNLHPTHVAQFPPLKPDAKPVAPGINFYDEDQYVNDPTYDPHLCRGEWLAYWTKWAVENCDKPVFVTR